MEEVVRSVYLFSTCTDKQMKRLCAALKRTPFPKGKDVMREGDAGDVMYVVESGRLQATTRLHGVVKEYSSGEAFGELALMKDEPRFATVTAIEACSLLALRRSDVASLLKGGELRAGLEAMEREYSAALRTAVEVIFNQIDTNGDGLLDPQEVHARLSTLGITEQHIENVFYRLDCNHNGAIELEEFHDGFEVYMNLVQSGEFKVRRRLSRVFGRVFVDEGARCVQGSTRTLKPTHFLTYSTTLCTPAACSFSHARGCGPQDGRADPGGCAHGGQLGGRHDQALQGNLPGE